MPTLRESQLLPDTLLSQVLDQELKLKEKAVSFLAKNIKPNKKLKVQDFLQLVQSRLKDYFDLDLNRCLIARAQLNALLRDQRAILIDGKSLTLAQATVQQIVCMTALNDPAIKLFKNLSSSVHKELAAHCQKAFYLTDKATPENLSASVSSVFEFLLTEQLPPLIMLKDPSFYQAFMWVGETYPALQVSLIEKLFSVSLRALSIQDKGDDFTDDDKALISMLWQVDQGLFFDYVLQRAAEQPNLAILNYLQSAAFSQEWFLPNLEEGYQRFRDFFDYYVRNKDSGPSPRIHGPLAEDFFDKIHVQFMQAFEAKLLTGEYSKPTFAHQTEKSAEVSLLQTFVNDIFSDAQSLNKFLSAKGTSSREKIQLLFRACGDNSEQKERLCFRLLSYFQAGLNNQDTFLLVPEIVDPTLLHLINAKTLNLSSANGDAIRHMIIGVINSIFGSSDSHMRFFGGPDTALERLISLRALCDKDEDLVKIFKNACGAVKNTEENSHLYALLKTSFNQSNDASVKRSCSDNESVQLAVKTMDALAISSIDPLRMGMVPPVVHGALVTAIDAFGFAVPRQRVSVDELHSLGNQTGAFHA